MTLHPSLAAHEREVEVLRQLSSDELKARWLALKGVPLPKYMRRDLMARAVAHAAREQREGGLDAASRKQLEALAATVLPGGAPAKAPRRKLRAGTRLLREWQGQVHEVAVVADGFVWRGERHRSLSEIARLITGTRWNGWIFFGLKGKADKAQGTRGDNAGRLPGRARAKPQRLVRSRPRQAGRAVHA